MTRAERLVTVEPAIREVWRRGMRGAGEHCPSPERSEVELHSLTERISRRQTGLVASSRRRTWINGRCMELLHCRIEVNSGFPAERGPFATGTS